MDRASIVVHPPGLDGSRRVTRGDEPLGVASHIDDVSEILRLADLYVTDIETSDLIDWQGGGPDDWPGLSEHHERPHHERPHHERPHREQRHREQRHHEQSH